MKKSITWILIAVLIIGGGYAVFRIRRVRALQASIEEIRKNVSMVTVERRNLDIIVTGKGTVQANTKKTVQPGVSGTVSDVLIAEGDIVKEGTPLLTLSNDSVEYDAEQARLDLSLAKQQLDSMTGLAGTKAKAELELRQAELDLTEAEEDFDGLTITAPIAGDLWDIAVEKGDNVKPGQVLAIVADISSFGIEAAVRQPDLPKIGVGMKVRVKPGGDMEIIDGVIESVASEGVSGSKGIEFPVEISMPDPGPDLRAGMSVQVDCHLRNGGLVSMTGKVVPEDRRDIEATVSGTVKEVTARKGLMVRENQLLLTIESDAVMVAYDRAKNAVESARQTLATCESDIEEQGLKVAKAQIAADDKAKLAAKLTVKSPIDGKVISVSAESGDDVKSTDTLFEVASVAPLTVVIPVDELDVSNVVVGQKATVEVDALPGQILEGMVSKIAEVGKVQQGITNYDVTIEVQSQDIRLGMSATATIAVAEKENVVTVPVEAITWDEDQAYVNKIVDGKPVQTRVKVGVQGDLYAEIASGLSEGETVAVGDLSAAAGLDNFRMMPGGQAGGFLRPR